MAYLMQLLVSNALGKFWYEKDSIPAYLAVFKQTEYIGQTQRCLQRSGVATEQ